jgi:hypothetical protein
MRRFVALIAVTLLGVTAAAVPLSVTVAQQEEQAPVTGELWEGVEQPVPVPEKDSPGGEGEVAGGDQVLRRFDVPVTMEFAAVPAVEQTEYLVIEVVEGQFALDQGATSAIIVDPADDGTIPFMTPYSPAPPHYKLDPSGSQVTTADGTDCTYMCAIPANRVVQLDPGDTVYALPEALCVLCLQNSGTGLLRVSALMSATSFAEDFSWLRAWNNKSVSFVPASSKTMRAWAFNPSPNCRGN